MLVRDRTKKRGPRKSVEMTPPKKRLAKSTASIKTMKSSKKRMEKTNMHDEKIFRQKAVNNRGLDLSYEHVGSVSPIKYRPRIDMEGAATPGRGDASSKGSPVRSQS